MDRGKIQVLSLDGGGFKGLYSAAFLAALEEDHTVSVLDHFDLIVGTSTGALIACGLAIGLKPRELVRLYSDKGETIFQKKTLSPIRHFFGRKYDSNGLKNELERILGDGRIKESLRKLIIPAYNHTRDEPRLFKTPHSSRYHRDGKLRLVDVALASAAAPSYFSAHDGIENSKFIDGGVWANNPVMIGLVECITSLGHNLDDVSILSVGTGSELKGYNKRFSSGGMLQWGNEALRVFSRGQSLSAVNQAALLIGERLMRVDPLVASDLLKLDDTKNEEELLSLAARDSLKIGIALKDKFFGHRATDFKTIKH